MPVAPAVPDRRLFCVGLALLLGCPAGAVGLAVLGSDLNLAEPPRVAIFGAASHSEYVICGYEGTCGFASNSSQDGAEGQVTVLGSTGQLLVAVAPIGDWQGGLLPVSGSTFQPGAAVNLSCLPTVLVYAGTGPDAYAGCESETNVSLIVYNSVGPSARSVFLPREAGRVEGVAVDTADSVVYCLQANETVDAIQMPAGTAVPSFRPIAESASRSNSFGQWGGWGSGALVLFDQSDGRLLVPNVSSPGLDELDPTSGNVLATVPVPGWIETMSEDAFDGRLYVSYTNGTLVLNSTTLEPEAQLSLLSTTAVMFDESYREAYFSAYGLITAVSLDTDQVVSGSAEFDYFTSVVAFDPTHDRFLGVEGGPAAPTSLEVVNASQTFTAPLPYSSVPGLGGGLPFDFGVVGFLTGVAILVVVLVRRSRRAELPASAI
jgi:hypothetical protein